MGAQNMASGLIRDKSSKLIKKNFISDRDGLSAIDSLKFNPFDRSYTKPIKCITFFSHLVKKTRNLEMILDYLLFNFKLSYDWFPINLISTVYFSIHSPNTLPDMTMENFMIINPKNTYNFSYSVIKTELLDSRYDTNCFEYDLDHKFANFNMRSDCITHCYQNHIRSVCNISELIPSDFLLRTEYLEQNKQAKFSENKGNCAYQIWKQTKQLCAEQCQFDCIFRYYTLNIRSEHDTGHFNRTGTFTMKIVHDRLPDVVIKYVPQITLISVLCNFGGILGMWLGLSILHIIKETFVVLKKLLKKPGNITIKVKNNINNEMHFTKSRRHNHFRY